MTYTRHKRCSIFLCYFCVAHSLAVINTGWSGGNACFSCKNNFVYFQHKMFKLYKKKRYFDAFSKYMYQITYGKWCQSADVLLAGHTFRASPQSPALHTPTFFAAQLRFLDEWTVLALRSCMVCSCTLYTWGIPTKKKSRKSIDQGNVGAKKHRQNGRSHVGGTCVKQLPSIPSSCELWHHPVGTTFLSFLPHAFGVLDAESCLTCWRSALKSLKLQSPPLQKSKDQQSLPSKHHTTLSLLSCGEVFGVVLMGSLLPRTNSSVYSQIHSDGNELRHSSLPWC